MRHLRLSLLAVLSTFAIVGCGGGTSGSNTSSLSGTDVYPSSVALASPTSVVSASATVVAMATPPFNRRLSDWFETLRDGFQGNRDAMQAALRTLLPFSSAQAAPARIPEAASVAAHLADILAARASPSSTTLPLNNLFKTYTAANCYGPQVQYSTHDNGGSSGTLPSGDVGMWLSTETDNTPCSVAQLNRLMEPVKSRANGSFMLGAKLAALALANGGMPASNTSKPLSTEFATAISGLLPTGVTLSEQLAAVTNNGSNSYTYLVRLKFSNNKVIAFKITHNKTSATAYNGIMQYASSDFTQNASCTGKKTADAGSLRYNFDGTNLLFSAREAPYCVTNADELTTNFSDYLALDSNGELDPTKDTRTASSKGWDQQGSGFKRFAVSNTPSTQAGDYLFAWQAGTGDSHSRMFAARLDYNSVTENRDLKAYFGYGDNMSTTTNGGKMLGMICNWAGPNNSHSPIQVFQSQSASLTSTATAWTVSAGEKITYAPTNNCNSTSTMRFDVNANNVIASGEGASVNNNLDAPTSTRTTVFSELAFRGFTIPTYY